jgi:hypothetical protein
MNMDEINIEEMKLISAVTQALEEWWKSGKNESPNKCILNSEDFSYKGEVTILGIKCYFSKLIPKEQVILATDEPLMRF